MLAAEAGNVLEVVAIEWEEEEIGQEVAVSILAEETLEKLVDAPCALEGMALKPEALDSMTAMALRIWICCNRQAFSPPEHKS